MSSRPERPAPRFLRRSLRFWARHLLLLQLLVTILLARDSRTDATTRRRLRRLLLTTAALNLLVPNYYVNNGELHVPPSAIIRSGIEWIVAT